MSQSQRCWPSCDSSYLSYAWCVPPSPIQSINLHDFFPPERALQPEGLLHSRGMAESGLRHCPKFPTAASRRTLVRVSVTVWPVVLPDQLRIVAVVSLYPTIWLRRHRPLLSRGVLLSPAFPLRSYAVLARLSMCYPPRQGTFRCMTHPFAARRQVAPRCRSTCMCKAFRQRSI